MAAARLSRRRGAALPAARRARAPGGGVITPRRARRGSDGGRMLSRLQELRKEEETLLRVKAALHDQLNRLKVEELALQSMINAREGNMTVSSPALMEDHQNMDNEAAINQTKLQLQMHVGEEEEEEEESDS